MEFLHWVHKQFQRTTKANVSDVTVQYLTQKVEYLKFYAVPLLS